ncbi:MAG: hypothetical protein IPK07_00700 [Deltaproteobacteria bacterium]|nr:hypothetical protein [Deltaproteobacteria bacterium]
MHERLVVPFSRASLGALLLALAGTIGASGCSKDSPEVKSGKAACPIAVETVCTARDKEYANRCVAECAKETEIVEGNCKASKGG